MTIRSLIICIWVFSNFTLANKAKAQDLNQVYLSMNVTEATLQQVIHQIQQQTVFTFFYQDGLLDTKGKKVSISAGNVPLRDILDEIADQLQLSYKQTNNTIALKKREEKPEITEQSYLELPQTGITGTVSDDTGPLPGVNIVVKGTSIGTQTDFDGHYSLTDVPDDAILVFSYIGFVTQEIKAANQTTIDVTLRQDAQALDEVVVIGYGTRKRKDVTGAVGSANLEDFRQVPVSNVGQLLQGNLPGLNVGPVVSAGSTPSISVRGRTTISGNQNVLIILDGIQYNGSLESINPNDIESMDVLKDASSVAVYGAQGANGVILITTKQGKKNQRPRVTISTSYATQEPSKDLSPLNRDDYLEHIRKLQYENAYLGPDYINPNPDFDLADYIDSSMLDENGNIVDTNFNWWDEGTQLGFINEQKISVSGGSEKIRFLISLDHTNQEGFIVNDKFQRKGARINLSTNATDWWEVGVQSFASFVNKDGAEPSITDLVRTSPLLKPFDEEGNLIPNPANTAVQNPFIPYYVDNYERHDYFFANFFSKIDFPFLEGLSYRVNFGNNYRINKNYGASEYGSGLTGSAYKNHDFYYDYNLDNIINYNRTFGKHAIDLTLLYGAIERKFEYTGASANDFARLDLGYNSLEQGVNQFTYSDAWREALNYQMARLDYRFDDRYLLTATIRRDGFSGFAANNKYGYFPSVALAWNINNENFFKADWVSNLKLRVGYGTSSNQTSRYSSLAGVTTRAAYVFGDGGSTVFGQQLTSLANPNLRWERTTGINLGLEYGFLNARINGTVEYYYTRTNDLLFDVAIPDITGFETIRTNIGEIENQGFEFAIKSLNIGTDNFKWNTTVNFATNTTEVLELIGRDNDGDGVEDDLTASNLFIGEPLGVIYDYETDGIYQIGDDIPDGYFPGSYRIIDQNGDGEITPADDRVILGHSNPAYRFSILNTFKYKGISLRVFINSIQGGKNGYMQNNIYPITLDDNNIRWNYLNDRDLWQPNHPEGIDPVFPGKNPRVSPAVYGDRSFVRLQDVSLSYDFDKDLVNKLKMESLQVFISGKNIATWTKWRGWDPETGVGLGSGGRPLLRSYSLGLNVTF
ncbi:TonB-dependent receptor [Galbibacter pacificus]|uniref:TonB-dependent receptor n=1 Tax=Galbibacter pacificus TaxID=2996052 RepID=A0ABT6FN26_9FLAO|nr:TonB-dependent receptor [Galbibacter pacificus]MDG3581188.1 TonB-dependent receptor [Galbibacter pacificus]MDG3584666.1 TonB-dependent receptor [Galbibacter pacificus]